MRNPIANLVRLLQSPSRGKPSLYLALYDQHVRPAGSLDESPTRLLQRFHAVQGRPELHDQTHGRENVKQLSCREFSLWVRFQKPGKKESFFAVDP